jgi:hypothetical protein
MAENPRFELSTYEKAQKQLRDTGIQISPALDQQISEAKSQSTEKRSELNKEIVEKSWEESESLNTTKAVPKKTKLKSIPKKEDIKHTPKKEINPVVIDPNRTEISTDTNGTYTNKYKNGKRNSEHQLLNNGTTWDTEYDSSENKKRVV